MADRQLRIFPFEIAAWVGLIAAVVFLRLHNLRIDWVTFEYTVPPLIPVMGRFLVGGILIYLVYLLLRRRSIRPYLKRLATWRWWILTARLWTAIIVFTYTYFWLPSVSFGIAFFCAIPAAKFRRRFVLSCVLIWTLGAWMYVAVPGLGPIYAHNEVFQEIVPQLPKADAGQGLLWDNYQTVIAGRIGGLKQFNPTRGIAALPSLHVGAHWLLMLWCRRFARPLFVPALIGTLLTLLGSIVTGWHYAVDGYVGIALAQLSYWVSNLTERPPKRVIESL